MLAVAERDAVPNDCLDPRMVHGSCDVITPLLSTVPRRVDHYDFAKLVGQRSIDSTAAYLAYRRSAGIDCSFLSPSNCWFPYIFAYGRVHPSSAAVVISLKRAASGELALPQTLAVRVVTSVVDELNRCSIADAVVHLVLPPRLDEATSSVLPSLLGVVADVLAVDLYTEGDWNLLDVPLSGFTEICSSSRGELPPFKGTGTKF